MLFTAKERKGKPFLGIVLLHQNLKLLRPLYCRKIWVSSGSGVIVKTSFEGILQASYRLIRFPQLPVRTRDVVVRGLALELVQRLYVLSGAAPCAASDGGGVEGFGAEDVGAGSGEFESFLEHDQRVLVLTLLHQPQPQNFRLTERLRAHRLRRSFPRRSVVRHRRSQGAGRLGRSWWSERGGRDRRPSGGEGEEGRGGGEADRGCGGEEGRGGVECEEEEGGGVVVEGGGGGFAVVEVGLVSCHGFGVRVLK